VPTAVDDSPSPNPSSRSPLTLGFRPPNPDDLLSSSLPSPSTSPESDPSPEGPELASGDDWLEDEWSGSPDDTPSQGSTPDSDPVKVELFDLDELKAVARAGVAVAGEKAHDLFASTPGQQHVDLWKTDATDQATIGDPLASIAARHQGVAGKVNPDTKDLLSAMVGLFGYATKQINKRTEARALDAGAAGPQPMPEPVDL
jgi:hypothetical protein